MSFNSTFYNSTVSYQNEKSFAFFILKNHTKLEILWHSNFTNLARHFFSKHKKNKYIFLLLATVKDREKLSIKFS